MERRCNRCKELINIAHDTRICPLCDAVLEGSESGQYNIAHPSQWKPVDLPAGLVDEAPLGTVTKPISTPVSPSDSVSLRAREEVMPEREETTRRESVELKPSTIMTVMTAISRINMPVLGVVVLAGIMLVTIPFAVFTFMSGAKLLYVSWPETVMYNTPAGTRPLSRLQRGQRVDLIAKGNHRHKVRDLDGHIGFVDKRHLVPKPPAYTSNSPFYGCRQYLTEPDSSACHQRVDRQQRLCREHCSPNDINDQCRINCHKLSVECRAGCQ